VVSGKKVTAIVITALLFRKPPAIISEALFSSPHFPIKPLKRARRKPLEVNKIQTAAILQTTGSLKRIIGAIAEELAAITRIRHIFAKGSIPGQIVSGIFPLLVSFNVTAIIVGITTINESEIAIPLISICTFVPIKSERVAGTTKGASKVSSNINVRPNALLPLKIVTQIKPETAVGPANNKTKPVMISGLENIKEEEKRAANGIII